MKKVPAKLRALLARVAAFLAPSAFEARARRREQLKLRRELAEVDETLAWCKGRRAFAEERLRKLEQQELAATLATLGIKPGSLAARQAVGRALRKPQVWEPAGEPAVMYGFNCAGQVVPQGYFPPMALRPLEADETHGAGAAG